MDRITAEQARRNQEARHGWQLYARHRQQVTRLLLNAAPPSTATLCVLGAGNCNDLDLSSLRQHFRAIHLVDLDPEALEAGCELQQVRQDPAIQRHGGIDVTGIASQIAGWSQSQQPSPADIDRALYGALQQPIAGLPPGPFQVVASVGLLTQLIEMVDQTLGNQHPQFLALMSAVRLRHLRTLLELTQPGGQALLFVEVVSSITCPELLQTPETHLPALLQQALQRQNFFTGANPAVLARLFREDPRLAAMVSRLQLIPPWLWTFFTRTYAVMAFQASRNDSAARPMSMDPAGAAAIESPAP